MNIHSKMYFKITLLSILTTLVVGNIIYGGDDLKIQTVSSK